MLEEEEEREREREREREKERYFYKFIYKRINILIKFYLKNMTFYFILLKTRFLQFYLHKY